MPIRRTAGNFSVVIYQDSFPLSIELQKGEDQYATQINVTHKDLRDLQYLIGEAIMECKFILPDHKNPFK